MTLDQTPVSGRCKRAGKGTAGHLRNLSHATLVNLFVFLEIYTELQVSDAFNSPLSSQSVNLHNLQSKYILSGFQTSDFFRAGF